MTEMPVTGENQVRGLQAAVIKTHPLVLPNEPVGLLIGDTCDPEVGLVRFYGRVPELSREIQVPWYRGLLRVTFRRQWLHEGGDQIFGTGGRDRYCEPYNSIQLSMMPGDPLRWSWNSFRRNRFDCPR